MAASVLVILGSNVLVPDGACAVSEAAYHPNARMRIPADRRTRLRMRTLLGLSRRDSTVERSASSEGPHNLAQRATIRLRFGLTQSASAGQVRRARDFDGGVYEAVSGG